ncbi:MAG TPA: ABC transporter ATP-binding protein [Firmicutes bacterium]|nr:ABC transporter ATP-binding protein [Bacillota bacterium]
MQHLIFKLENLSKRYKKIHAVNDLSLEGYAGEIIGFLGPNGAGKTTTIRMMTGLIKPDSGTILLNGHDLHQAYEQSMASVGCIIETPYLYESMTGRDHLTLFSSLFNIESQHMKKVIDLSKLGDRLDDKVKTYSLGMKQRLGISIALLKNPKLLILDEPTNGLDPQGIRELRDFLKYLAHEEGVCVFVSSHLLFEMEQLCDRVAILSQGKLIHVQKISHLEPGHTLEDCFMSVMRGV